MTARRAPPPRGDSLARLRAEIVRCRACPRLRDAWITAACRCAPPLNRPEPGELARCAPFLDRELALLSGARAGVALGAVAWTAVLRAFARAGHPLPRPRPRFRHGAVVELPGAPALVGSYHPSRQNTQTGRLTPAMLDGAIGKAVELARR